MVPSRWFSREGPFVGAHYALEIASVQLRRRVTVYNLQPICYALYHKRGLMACAFLFLNDLAHSLAHAHVGSNPILGGHCPYSIPVFITSMPPITSVA